LLPDRHARSEHRHPKQWGASCRPPSASLGRLEADDCASAIYPGRSPFFHAAFRSPAATSHLAMRSRSRVIVPGLHSLNDHEILPNCWVRHLRLTVAITNSRGNAHRNELRSLARSRTLHPSPSLRSPLGLRDLATAPSRRIVALNPGPAEKACLCKLPDLPSLPGTTARFRPVRPGSSFRIRYFSPGSLVHRTSWNHTNNAPRPERGQQKNRA
jgi:hypothetical protein